MWVEIFSVINWLDFLTSYSKGCYGDKLLWQYFDSPSTTYYQHTVNCRYRAYI